jgi:hypothetical protein
MSRLLRHLALVLLVCVFLLALPGLMIAQDSDTPTPEPTPIVTETPAPPVEEPTPEEPARDRSETVITIALIVVGTLTVLFGTQLLVLARSAFTSQSPLVQEIVRMNSTRVLDELDRRAAATPSKLDDEAVAEIRRLVLQIIAEQRAGVPPA